MAFLQAASSIFLVRVNTVLMQIEQFSFSFIFSTAASFLLPKGSSVAILIVKHHKETQLADIKITDDTFTRCHFV